MKVHELAKELGVTNKALVMSLAKIGIKVKNHLQVLERKEVETARAKLQAKGVPAKSQTVKKPTKAAAASMKPAPRKEAALGKEIKIKKTPAKEITKPALAAEPILKEKKKVSKPASSEGITKPALAAEPILKEKKKVLKLASSEEITAKQEVKSLPKAEPVKPAAVKTEISKPSPAKSVQPIKQNELALPAQVKVPVQKSVTQEARVSSVPKPAAASEIKASVIRVKIPITVGALADLFRLRPAELIKSLIDIGIFANINQLLNEEIVYKVAAKLNLKIEKVEDEREKIFEKSKVEDKLKTKPRAPVVTMMGHVDHGKTSLLDAIRKTKVASGEAGSITQHIGAYMVDIPGKGHVTFLDTPGHEAFTAIRARGANVTDIVVLVVAADDGVMPQTLEAIDHARAAGCPILVAVNKSDLPTANLQRAMTQLQKLELVAEEWGGKTIFVKVSAKTGDGIEGLLEMLLLQAEVMELKANPDCEAQGTVLEAKLTKGQGAVSTVLVQRGALHVGDIVVAGRFYGKVRAMRNDRGKSVKEAGPSYAVEVLGLSGVPDAGELFTVVNDEKIARQIAEKRELEIRERDMKGLHSKHFSLQELYSKMKKGELKELKLILKADMQGSLEGLTQTLTKSVSDKINVRVIHGGVGGVNESDAMLAMASDAVIIGFHVKAEPRAQELIEKEGIDARYYSVIYEAVQDVQKAMEGLLEPTSKVVIEGRVEIRQVFKSSKVGNIGGAIVLKGRLSRNHRVRLIRDNIVVFEGKLSSLRRFKDDVREVQEGYECGVALEGFSDLHEKDLLEAYKIEKVAAKLV